MIALRIAKRVPLRKSRRRIWRGVAVVLTALAASAMAMLYWPMDVGPALRTERSPRVVDRNGETLFVFLNSREEWSFPAEMTAISPYLAQATLAAEDQRFHLHPGVDPVAIARAAVQNLRSGRVVSGASTLTMQVVKRDAPVRRSWPGKLRQAALALRLERRATKQEIFTTYLNTAPYGMNLAGCEAASRRYFGKPAAELTLPEAALLAGLPRAPSLYMPLTNPGRAKERRDFVLRRMAEEKYIRPDELARALAAPLGASWHDFPGQAPHVAMRFKGPAEDAGAATLTLDAKTQAFAECAARESLAALGAAGANAAAIVIDTESAEILAWVGSGDFYNTPGGGQFDAARAIRSPGSALKPFVYAQAIETNRLYPSEVLLDAPLDFGRWQTSNYDLRYCGRVSADEALRLSLNIPAVVVLERIGVEPLRQFLAAAGLSTLTLKARDYGAGLTLGLGETRLDELAAAYVMLANLGEYRPLKIRRDGGSPPAPVRLISRGACLSLYSMMTQPLPDEMNVQGAVNAPAPVCWKTGTSSGNRDAWAFVFNLHYVVGVWIGHNDGASDPALVGAQAALPLAGRIFRFLPAKAASPWPAPGEDLKQARVCAASGLPASTWCGQTREVWLPRDQLLLRTCQVHFPGPVQDGALTVAERWPGTARDWDLADIDVPAARLRVDAPDAPIEHNALRILQPADRAEYLLAGAAGGDRIRLRAAGDESRILHWYLDDLYLGASKPGTPLFWDLQIGEHGLACMGPDGATDRVVFSVNRAF